MVSEVVVSWPRQSFQRLAVIEGKKVRLPMTGPAAQWLRAEISFPDPMSGSFLVARSANPVNWPIIRAPFPPKTSLETLIWVASSRYTVEQCIKEAKGETG
jgi:hypothetical protein